MVSGSPLSYNISYICIVHYLFFMKMTSQSNSFPIYLYKTNVLIFIEPNKNRHKKFTTDICATHTCIIILYIYIYKHTKHIYVSNIQRSWTHAFDSERDINNNLRTQLNWNYCASRSLSRKKTSSTIQTRAHNNLFFSVSLAREH